MAKTRSTGDRTIEAVLDEFLREHGKMLSERTMRQYDSVVQLLVLCLDGYGWNHISEQDEARVAERRKAPGMEWKFSALFGPEHIVGCYDEFLGYFMVRKVAAGKDLARAARATSCG